MNACVQGSQQSRRPPLRQCRHQQRGFALPVVLVVLMLVSVVSAVMLQRQASQRLISERRLGWYREHHARFGFEELIDAWLRSLPRNVMLLEVVGENGHALDIDLRDGTIVSIYLRDGQGALLVSPDAVEPAARETVIATTERFDQIVGINGRPLERRTVGPRALSLRSASPEAMRAVVDTISGVPGSGLAFANAIVAERTMTEDGSVSDAALTAALRATELTEEQAQPLRAAFVQRPTLYFVVVELRPKSALAARSAETVRFGGYIPVRADRVSEGQSAFAQRSGFLSFERLPVE
jgi:hypothetical protein